MPSLRREEVVTIQVLSAKQVPSRAIARHEGPQKDRLTVRTNPAPSNCHSGAANRPHQGPYQGAMRLERPSADD